MQRLDMSLHAIIRRILSELNGQIVDHGERMAYMYLKMTQYRNIPDSGHVENMMLAYFAHDIGAYKTEKFLDLLSFDVKNTLEHCIYGYLFMKYFSPVGDDAEAILYHHTVYADRAKYNSTRLDDGILMHLLDRADILNMKGDSAEDIVRVLEKGAGSNFNPQDVEDFIKADEKYHIIESLKDGTYKVDVMNYLDDEDRTARLVGPIVDMLAYEVDFLSEQTVVHTITLTILAEILGRKLGLSDEEIWETRAAARIHDLGKIKIPISILEKAGRLTPEEFAVMKKHILYTEIIIGDIVPRKIVRIAVRHHERLDGTGYPRGLTGKELTVQERLLAVADMASALMQRRSYKEAMDKQTVVSILSDEADRGRLDADIVNTLIEDYDEIVGEVADSVAGTISTYENLTDEYNSYLRKYSSEEHKQIEEFGLFSLQP